MSYCDVTFLNDVISSTGPKTLNFTHVTFVGVTVRKWYVCPNMPIRQVHLIMSEMKIAMYRYFHVVVIVIKYK